MIYDCFIFYNELDLLKLRLETVDPHVDRFVLVESTTTFAGKPKPPIFKENEGLFERFLDKIEYVLVEDMPRTKNAWRREGHQRNAMLRGLNGAKPDDIVLMSDLDEIPNVPNIVPHIQPGKVYRLDQRLYYYYYNLRKGDWKRAMACELGALHYSPESARRDLKRPVIRNAGWHFSYIMSPEKISEKIKAFSHQEFNSEEYTAVEKIAERVSAGLDIFGRSEESYTIEDIDDTFPSYLVENQDVLSDFIISELKTQTG